jgi:hypothetical protein
MITLEFGAITTVLSDVYHYLFTAFSDLTLIGPIETL